MIAILKIKDTLPGGIFAHSGASLNYLEDKILIEKIPYADFPLFDITTDSDDGEILQRKVSEFAVRLSLLQTEKSANGKTILEFLRDTSDNFRYMFAMEIAGTVYTGSFSPEDVSADYTYSENRYHVEIVVRGLEQELKKYLTSVNSDFPGITSSSLLQFEDYIENHHLGGFNVEFPAQTLSQKLGADYVFSGYAYRRTGQVTNWGQVDRWETFTGLYRGMGFDFHIKPVGSIQQIYDNSSTLLPRELIKIRIFWHNDIINSEPIVLTHAIEHSETILPRKTQKNILLRSWEAVYEPTDQIIDPNLVAGANFTGQRGIILNKRNYYIADARDTPGPSGSWRINSKFFMYSNANFIVNPNSIPEQNYILYIKNLNGFNNIPAPFDFVENGFLKDEVYTIDLKQYSMPFNVFTGQWNKPGVVYYWRFLYKNNDQNFSNNELAQFAIDNYRRYLSSGNKKAKVIETSLNDLQNVDVYKKVTIYDVDGDTEYYISRISKLDYSQKRIKIELVEL